MFPETLPIKQEKRGEEFTKEFPVGTLVINTSYVYANLRFPYGWTAPGEVYENPDSTKVNIFKIDGIEGASATWDIDYLQKGVIKNGVRKQSL